MGDTFGGAGRPPDADAPSRVSSNVTVIRLEDELRQSFIDYAMSVIVDRALPDVRDGLKPVHRRVLYDMYDLRIWNSGQTKKSARVVGDVIGRFHPHGDAAVYETMVRMAQWFSMRAPLIFGQGNFGNIDGDGAAAMRYTEVKMTRIAELMLQDIDKETVNTYPNYDGNEQIPEVLPTRFPNLLVNGSSGIAVGMATNIPPHNMGEVIDGTIALLANPDLTLEELMHHIPGPDFPTGGYIIGGEGIREAYATGRGRCLMRARTHVETDRSGRRTIYVDEIPYVVRKSELVRQIADLMREKKIEGISEINDLSDKDHPVRIAIDLKRDAFEEAVLNNLYEKTRMQESFAINMVALVGTSPRQLPLLDILREFLNFRREVVTRRTVFLLRQDRRRAFLNEGRIVAKGNIQHLIDIITNSLNADDARQRLMAEPWDATLITTLLVRDAEGRNICLPQGIEERAGLHDGHYFLAEDQARDILAMQLQRLTHLATEEIQDSYRELIGSIQGYLRILNDRTVMDEVIRTELSEVRDQYSDARKSEITVDYARLSKGDLIARQDVVVTMSHQGYVKYMDLASYESQKRGGKGRAVAKLKEEDYITRVVVASTHDSLLCFTSAGRCFVSRVYDLPTSDNRTWRGRPVQNIFNIEENELITALLPIPDDDEDIYEKTCVFMATARGLVKKIALAQLRAFVGRSNANAIKVIRLADDDLLIGVELTSGDDDIVLISSQGKAIRFCEYHPGRAAADGSAEEGDAVSDGEAEAELAEDEGEEAPEGGTADSDRHRGSGVRESGRTAGGIRGIRLPPGARVVSLIVVAAEEVETTRLLMASANGFGKLMSASEIGMRNRGGQGVIVMKNLERNGEVVGAGLADGDDNSEYMLITDQGRMIRSQLSGISVVGRYASGIILMRPADGERVIALQTLSGDIVQASHRQAQARRHERSESEGRAPGSHPDPEADASGGGTDPGAGADPDGGTDPDGGAAGPAGGGH